MDRTYGLIKQAQSGDGAAMETLLRENAGLVWSIVKKFAGQAFTRGFEQDDLFQIGSIGLMKCVSKFDTGYEVRFSTYAVPMILGEIKRFLRDDGIIKISRPLKIIASKARYQQDLFIKRECREPTISELAGLVGVERDELVVALESSTTVESIFSAVADKDGGSLYLIDKLASKDSDDRSAVDKIALRQVIGRLKPRERQIIMLRYFDDLTQSEIAKKIGVSQVQVSRIEKKILKELKESLCS